MMRPKTKIELSETPADEAARLRGALFEISLIDDFEEMKRIAERAMRGELHGHELPPPPDMKE